MRGCSDKRYLTVQFPRSNRRGINQMSAALGTASLKGKERRTEIQGGPPLLFSFILPRIGFTEHVCSLSATQCQISTGMLIYTTGLLSKITVLCCWQLSSTVGKAGGEGEGSQRLSAGNRNAQILMPVVSKRNSSSPLSTHVQIKYKILAFLKTFCILCLAWLQSFLDLSLSWLPSITTHRVFILFHFRCTDFNPNDRSAVSYNRIWWFEGWYRYLWTDNELKINGTSRSTKLKSVHFDA